jgi:DoxX-like family
MRATIETAPTSATRPWTGWILTGIPALFLLLDTVIHLIEIPPVVEAFVQLGYSPTLARPIGVIELVCLVLYMIPRTSVLGAILLTGYLGGAIASNLRVGNPLFSHVLFPVYVGALLWAGLYLREPRLRAIFRPAK